MIERARRRSSSWSRSSTAAGSRGSGSALDGAERLYWRLQLSAPGCDDTATWSTADAPPTVADVITGHPRLVEAGTGTDPAYAAWVSRAAELARQGRLLYFFADWETDDSNGVPLPARTRAGRSLEEPPAVADAWLCSASHAARARLPARASQASWTTSVSSSSESSPIREPRSSTDGWPSKCGVLKNGVDSSRTSACLSSSESTQKTITSS